MEGRLISELGVKYTVVLDRQRPVELSLELGVIYFSAAIIMEIGYYVFRS